LLKLSITIKIESNPLAILGSPGTKFMLMSSKGVEAIGKEYKSHEALI